MKQQIYSEITIEKKSSQKHNIVRSNMWSNINKSPELSEAFSHAGSDAEQWESPDNSSAPTTPKREELD